MSILKIKTIKFFRLPSVFLFKRKAKKNLVQNVYKEISCNLERAYVAEQRQFIVDSLELSAWHEAKHFSGFKFPIEVQRYADGVTAFNDALKDVREFEQMYSASIENKTRQNAEVLHEKKEVLEKRFSGLLQLITNAERRLRQLIPAVDKVHLGKR